MMCDVCPQLQHAARLPSLEELDVRGNPVCDAPGAEQLLLAALPPSLTALNGQLVQQAPPYNGAAAAARGSGSGSGSGSSAPLSARYSAPAAAAAAAARAPAMGASAAGLTPFAEMQRQQQQQQQQQQQPASGSGSASAHSRAADREEGWLLTPPRHGSPSHGPLVATISATAPHLAPDAIEVQMLQVEVLQLRAERDKLKVALVTVQARCPGTRGGGA